MRGRVHRLGRLALVLLNLALISRAASAELFINEIFFNPGGQASDTREEYIELRGTPNMPLANHYLVFLENELDEAGSGDAGKIEGIFDLGAYSLGSNGFMVIRQKSNRYSNTFIAPGATSIVNAGTIQGFGSAGGSTIGYSDDHSPGDPNQGTLSNSGATALLIYNHGGLVPTIGFDLDQGKDGLDSRPGSMQEPLEDWDQKWSILDSIGYFAEAEHSEFGRLYGNVNFVAFDPNLPFGPPWEPQIEPGTDYEMIPYEIEYLGRWGNSTGQTVDDWHVSNLTDNFGSGYLNNTYLLRQSCSDTAAGSCHPGVKDPSDPPIQPELIESNKDVPYGAIITGSFGAPNYLTGDFNKDGIVDAADYTVWRNTLGNTGSEYVLGPPAQPLVHNHPPADANHDFVVDADDYTLWKANFGLPNGLGGGSGGLAGRGSFAVPEPASWLLCVAIGLLLLASRRGKPVR